MDFHFKPCKFQILACSRLSVAGDERKKEGERDKKRGRTKALNCHSSPSKFKPKIIRSFMFEILYHHGKRNSRFRRISSWRFRFFSSLSSPFSAQNAVLTVNCGFQVKPWPYTTSQGLLDGLINGGAYLSEGAQNRNIKNRFETSYSCFLNNFFIYCNKTSPKQGKLERGSCPGGGGGLKTGGRFWLKRKGTNIEGGG